jgi:hypothetical protein
MDHRSLLPLGCDSGVAAIPSEWRQAEGGLWVPKGRRIIGQNIPMDSAQEEFLKRWSYISGSSRTLKEVALGTGYTDPTRTDTALTTELDSKDIESWDDALIAPDSSNYSVRYAVNLWLSTEANGVISEVGFKFDNGDLATHALWQKLTITWITNASEGVVTFSEAHGLSTGDEIHILSVGGMTEVNGSTYTITVVDADEVSLDGEDTSGYGSYSSGTGYGYLVVTKTSGEVLETKYGTSLTS